MDLEKILTQKKYESLFNSIKDILCDFTVATISIAFLLMFCVSTFNVDGRSMYPTLNDGQMVVAQKITRYRPERGDIVVVQSRNYPADGSIRPLVKRVIAKGGDTVYVDYDNNKVYVNGALVNEPYINVDDADPLEYLDGAETEQIVVPANCIYVMGDNRNHSLDSRYEEVGPVDVMDVLGIVVGRH